MSGLEQIIVASFERAPWGWALTFGFLGALIKGWPALSDAAMRARASLSNDRRQKYDRFEQRIENLERKLNAAVEGLHLAELKLVRSDTAYRLVIGELQKLDPGNDVLVQAQALLNVAYPTQAAPGSETTIDREGHPA